MRPVKATRQILGAFSTEVSWAAQVSRVALAFLAALVGTQFTQVHEAAAQAVNSGVGIAPSQQVIQPNVTTTQALDTPQVERLFGDWNNPQTRLSQDGINIQVDALTEFAGNVAGGTKQGATFANQVGLQADVNWERLAQIVGLSTHVIMVNRSGSSASALFGDHLSPVQEVYGSGGNVAVHLVSAYAQETLRDGRFDVAIGRMNVENDFANSPLYCNFMNNGLCGDPKALPAGDIGHSAYPDAVWAARLRVRPLPDLYLQAGLYETTQGLYGNANYRSGFKFSTAQDSGVYLPLEVGWSPSVGPDRMPGHYKVGVGYDSSHGYQDFTNPLATAGIPGYVSHTRQGNTQAWVLADQMLYRNGPGDTDGITALAGFVHNDPNNAAIESQYFVGVIDRAFWSRRPQDAIGLLFIYFDTSRRIRNAQDAEQAYGLALSNGATGRQTHEAILEINYDIHVLPGLNFEPNFQYVIRPNAQANIQNASVFGFKSHVEF